MRNDRKMQMTSHDESLEEVAERTGIVAAVTEIRRKVYRAIADAYPELLPECIDQQSLREFRVATTWS